MQLDLFERYQAGKLTTDPINAVLLLSLHLSKNIIQAI